MATNATLGYQLAEQEYFRAASNEAKLAALQKMLQTCPKHKASENMQKNIKERISKLKTDIQKEKRAKKSSGNNFLSVKKEGAAQIVLVGTTNSGKSTLLKQLTKADVEIAPYPFTTTRPEIGTLDHHGVKLQIVEVPAIVANFSETENGKTYLSLIRQADLIVLLFNTVEEKRLLDRELNNIIVDRLIYNHQPNLAEEIWRRLPLIKVYTKQPGKKKDHPPIALPKGSTIETLASHVHKDFIQRFRFARIWGSSKFAGQTVGLSYPLKDDDIVELHVA
ncbi:TGS domain-containing protein [Candidatus Woesearchaeota archaeon]|nr:TGS domain-containing protein [Candidatus Woesearchaeota archaeon]